MKKLGFLITTLIYAVLEGVIFLSRIFPAIEALALFFVVLQQSVPCFGLLFAMLLSILKAGSYGYYQILFVVMLMVVAGIKSSCGLLVKFIYLYTGGQAPFWKC